MNLLQPHEPINTWTHAAGALLSVVATVQLLRCCRGDAARRFTLLVYGLSLLFCYTASTLIHGLWLTPEAFDRFDRLDRFGIYVLIAGTYTPMAWVLLPGRWRMSTLACVWGVTAVAGIALAINGVFPPALNTGLYLAMGWGSVLCLYEIARIVSIRDLRWLVFGGVLYSVGAIINFIQWPALAPPVFGPHELFHLFVLGGSAAHLRFMQTVVIPFEGVVGTRDALPNPGRISDPTVAVAASGAGECLPGDGAISGGY